MGKVRTYTGEQINVTYEAIRCIHAAECVDGLPAVFDRNARPWVNASGAVVDVLAEVIERCPTGALHYERADGVKEVPDEINSVLIAVNGPLYVRGDMEIKSSDGGSVILRDTRVAFCRCGASHNKPFCDNSHVDAGFQAGDAIMIESRVDKNAPEAAMLTVTPRPNGSLRVEGSFQLKNANGELLDSGNKGSFCRCGASHNKPFCDSTHRAIGFQSEVVATTD